MPIPRVAAVLGGMLMSPAGRRFAGRHAGKLALATLALQMWEKRQARSGRPGAASTPHPRKRWSGRQR
jgi:hypothetical protein